VLRVEDIAPAEMHALLMRASFGHLGCALEGRPYVVPMNYDQRYATRRLGPRR
jgi:nitroimidazol reductase NimA-like FMN-containing flavoprotein (pyridoxamine 5'-phosphate oxidase superfamily)